MLVWDITFMHSMVEGKFFYFYLFTDLFSRFPVAGEVHQQQNAEIAVDIVHRMVKKYDMKGRTFVLHADNGSPMRSELMEQTLARYGIARSHSRPCVSNDNAFAESVFNTFKSMPDYPGKFETCEDAGRYAEKFLHYLGYEHLHSSLDYTTPASVLDGSACEIMARRNRIQEEARNAHPERWSGPARVWEIPDKVYLNPTSESIRQEKLRKMARNRNRRGGTSAAAASEPDDKPKVINEINETDVIDVSALLNAPEDAEQDDRPAEVLFMTLEELAVAVKSHRFTSEQEDKLARAMVDMQTSDSHEEA